ncbi:hypothetical protein PRIPAC_82755 [Pristionchus pacificus]|uniref:Uncharacterized protein n=1 Tax=Pristionchus pacificus TaxID=54126 RepID=A0A2A6CQ16_PRIPA|nr:hypothetical protein PRIPAC_82755 [Pristionchus pacificus]|eukprot:PDM80147.1 hypothetical protein PRIPAC_32726 [Pristionchus pacificus]
MSTSKDAVALKFLLQREDAITHSCLTIIVRWLNSALLAALPFSVRCSTTANAYSTGSVAWQSNPCNGDVFGDILIGENETHSQYLCMSPLVISTHMIEGSKNRINLHRGDKNYETHWHNDSLNPVVGQSSGKAASVD